MLTSVLIGCFFLFSAGDPEFDRLRPLSYPQTGIVIICFSVIDNSSFTSVKLKFLPEIRHHLPDVPILLLGLKCDLRNGVKHGDNEISFKDSRQLAIDIGLLNLKQIKEKLCQQWLLQIPRGILEKGRKKIMLCVLQHGSSPCHFY